MIGIIDYGMGNLRSVQKALEKLGHAATLLESPPALASCDAVILPGVGAFRDAIAELNRLHWPTAIHDFVAAGRPFLGICLGQQLLFERSFEGGEHQGLGLLAGEVVRFHPEEGLKIPHMGWNSLAFTPGHSLLCGIAPGEYVYFVHSYHVLPRDPNVVLAATTHGTQEFASVVGRGNVLGTQFHPEKSQRTGLQLLQNFATLATPALSETAG